LERSISQLTNSEHELTMGNCETGASGLASEDKKEEVNLFDCVSSSTNARTKGPFGHIRYASLATCDDFDVKMALPLSVP
jgi:hypothetical protein